jgi:cbb3-type cytochrome oxidase cytochrome c subunit
MEQLHSLGGVPRGWRFTVPPGDPAAGRKVFVGLECFKCHSVKGESFPGAPAKHAGEVGPDLAGMGDHHPAEYFAESILNPNKILVEAPGYIGPDGSSSHR